MSVYITRTNQKLYFARLHLEQLKEAEQSKGWSKHALIESFNESTLFHLSCAYHSFLREIAEVYRIEPKGIDTLEQLEAGLDAQGLETPEVRELQTLIAQNGWLAKVERAYRACWNAEEHAPARSSEHSSLSEIHVVQVNPDHSEEHEVIEQLDEWLGAFQGLVERLRESMKEW